MTEEKIKAVEKFKEEIEACSPDEIDELNELAEEALTI